MASGLLSVERAPLAVEAESGPVSAPAGTRAWIRVSLPGRTSTTASSLRP